MQDQQSQEILDIIKQQLNPKEVNLKGMGRNSNW